MNTSIDEFIRGLPKAELHIHIEGSLEPELIFEMATRNQVAIPYPDVASLRAAYAFTNLQTFLDIYYAGASVLITEQDFFDMAMAYFRRAHADSVAHAELFFDPQTHTERGITMGTVIDGLSRAQRQAKIEFGIDSALILCFLRHLSEDDAMRTLTEAEPHLHRIVGVGLDSSELGHPPEKFARVFARARELGLRLVAHAGEEGPPEYVWSALEVLNVERIDHGVQSIKDPALMTRLVETRMPLTVCPLSNIKLCVFKHLSEHNLGDMLKLGACVTINSDDPAYFGGYINQNFRETAAALNLDFASLKQLAANSFEASFIPEVRRAEHLARLDDYCLAFGV